MSPWLWAAVAGVLTAIAVFVALPDRSAPLVLISRVAGRDLRGVDVHGGVKITYRVATEAMPGSAGSAGDSDALARTARIIERRAAQMGFTDVRVMDGAISVEVAGVAPDAGDTVARTLISRGELSFHKVVHGSKLAQALYRRVTDGVDASVSVGEDVWSHDATYGVMVDYYLMAPDRGALERFLARAAAEDPALAPEPGRVFLFEHVRRAPDGFEDAEPFWRTYYAEAQSYLGNEHIADAHVYWDPVTGQAAVLASFDEAGAARFGELTSEHVGSKLAIVLDGTVTSAPVIQEAITGGRSTITMGGLSNAEIEGQAHALVAVLQSRTTEPLPVPLAVVSTEPLARTVTRAHDVAAALLLALLAGLAAFVLVRLVEHRAPGLDVALPGPAGARPWGRLAVTVAALAVVHAGTASVMLPGTMELAVLLMAEGRPLDGQLSVFALGITPFVSAFVLVEIVALLVPRWRPLRHGGPSGRAHLTRAAIKLAVVFALLQGWAVAAWLDALAANNPVADFSPGFATSAMLALTATAGVLVLWILAGLVSRYGLGNGISVILFAGITGVPGSLQAMGEVAPGSTVAGGNIALIGVAVCALVAVTSRVLRSRVGGPLGLRLPTCGIVPVVEANALMALPASIMTLGGAMSATAWMPEGIATRLALVAVLAAVFSLLFSRPGLAAGQVRAVDAGAAARQANAFRVATAISTAYVVGVAGLGWLLLRGYPDFAHDAMWMAVCTAVAMDVLADWRARRHCRELVAVWPVHRVQVADLAVRVLQDAGIGAHTRGRYHRSLLYFFGPFVPIEIMVPADRAGEATELLRSALGGEGISSPASPSE